jgi:predicted ATPase/DNA-binding winged helix-turn-helix (wHTH) protein
MALLSDTPTAVEFGRFRVLPHRRELLAEGCPTELGGRAFDVLMVLIDAAGAVVSKDTLMERVWPGRIVEENSLVAQIAALRRAFAADRDLIRTVAGRGYQFTGVIRTVSTSPGGPPVARTARASTNLLEPVSELIGRDIERDEILSLTASHRLVTLTGAGGIGKTRLGIEVARHLLPRFADGVSVAELAPLTDPDLVSVTVATALGLDPAVGAAWPERITNALGQKQVLLVLDNCEHVVDAAAQMAEVFLRANPATRVIATSRDPLRAEGEWIYPVPPLAVPAEASPGREEPLRYGAVRLFVERARAAEPRFSLDESGVAAVVAVCRRLDGIPLAIELAASRAATLGIEGLAARLDDRFNLLTGGKRTALPRQRTLRATLDWSYELLSESERAVWRRLAIFSGGFGLEAASAITANTEGGAPDIVDRLAGLVAKSLVTGDVSNVPVRYRLLDTMRAYALEKLTESGEIEGVARRHAEFFRDLVAPAAPSSRSQLTTGDIARYGREIDNVRAALDWSFSRAGDAAIGVALTAAYAPVWTHFELMAECLERTERALDSLDPDLNLNAPLRMQLHISLGVALTFTMGAVERTRIALAKALEAAESLDELDAQLRTLWCLCALYWDVGECRAAHSTAERFSRVAHRTGDASVILVGDRLIGTTLHTGGQQFAARRCFERVLELYVAPKDRPHTIWFQFDQRVLARTMLARVLWLQGFVDQAKDQAQASLEDAQAAAHVASQLYTVFFAVFPISVMTGDLAAAERALAMLIDLGTRHNTAYWKNLGHCLEGKLLIARGEFRTGSTLLRAALETCDRAGWTVSYPEILGVLAEGLAGLGRLTEALATIDQALARADHGGECWYVSELLRIKGELLLLEAGHQSIAAAEGCFSEALEVARQQGALFWELRCATSSARLWRDQARSKDAHELLAPVYDRFTEGFATSDLRVAKALIGELL